MKIKITLIVIALILTAAGVIFADVSELDPITVATLRLLTIVSGAAAAALIIWTAWGLIAGKLGGRKKPKEEPGESVEITEAPQITHAINDLQRVLRTLEEGTEQATNLILDATEHTNTLVKLIKSIALKSEAMRDEAAALDRALKAIAAQEPLEIATAAGNVKDAHLRELMLCNAKGLDYWAGVSAAVAAQLGTLQQWSAGYDKFTGNLLADVASAKGRIAGLTASKELAGVARPMLQTQANLRDAQESLEFQRRVHVGQAVGSLPGVNAGLDGGVK